MEGPSPTPVTAAPQGRARGPSHADTRGLIRRRQLRVVGQYLVTVYLLVTLIFVLPRALPGDPLRSFTDDTTVLSPEARAELEKVHGLDGTLLEQYGRYLAGLARGDLGDSIANSQPVSRLIRANLPWTLLLTGSALVLSTLIGFRMGVSAAWHRGTARDRFFQVASTVLRAVPEYAVATFLVIGLGVVVRVFPISGGFTPFQQSASLAYKVIDALWHLMLPLLAVTLGLLGTKFLMVRNMTIGVLGQDYMLLARAKGLPQRLQMRHHAGRSALVPYLNLVGTQIGIAVGGSVFVQEVFAYPGMGSLMVTAVNTQDYPVIEACFLILSLLVLTANLVVDLISSVVDPRTTAA